MAHYPRPRGVSSMLTLTSTAIPQALRAGESNMSEQKRELTFAKSPGRKAIETKGKIELERAGKMAAWTRQNGKNDAENPYSKENFYPK